MTIRTRSCCLHTVALATAALLAIGCNGGTDTGDATAPPTSAGNGPPPGSTTSGTETKSAAAVTLEIKSWKETEVLIAAQKGKVVVIDLWSTSCVPCMKEFPHLVALHEKFPSEKITCISVSCDYEGLEEEPPESKKPAVMKFLKSTNATCTNLLLSDPDVDVYDKIELAAIPAVFVYDAAGRMVKRFDNDSDEYGDEGFTYKDHIVPLVEKLIGGEPAITTGNDSR